MKNRFPHAAGVVALLVLTPGPSTATTLLKLSVEEMSRQAELIVTGKVTQVASQWSSDQTTIYTFTTVQVMKCVAGACGEKVLLKHRGGTVGDRTLSIPGTPELSQGQEVLLFLRKDPEGEKGYFAVVGMCQGLFAIEKGKGGQQATAVQKLGDVALAEPGEAGSIKITPGKEPIKMPLKSLLITIKNGRKALPKSED